MSESFQRVSLLDAETQTIHLALKDVEVLDLLRAASERDIACIYIRLFGDNSKTLSKLKIFRTSSILDTQAKNSRSAQTSGFYFTIKSNHYLVNMVVMEKLYDSTKALQST